MPDLYDQDAELLREVDDLLNDAPKAPPKEINWDDYDFDFADEFPAEPEIRTRTVARPASARPFSIDEMRRLHDGAPETATPSELSEGVRRSARAAEPKPRKPRRKRRLLKALLALLLAALLACGIFALVMLLIADQPISDQPIGARKPGCSAILLAGTDASGERTDTLMLLYVDREQRQISLLSIPRDTMVNRDNPVPKINGAYYANGAGEKGMGWLMDYTKDLIGYRPDGYLLIDLDCFVDLVDCMGGVRYNVPTDMYYDDPTQDLHIDLKAGEQRLNGEAAMGLVRFRSGYAMADLERVSVQRDFLKTALRQWSKPWKLIRAPFALRLLLKHTQTDLTAGNLSWLAQAVLHCGTADLRTNTLPGAPATVNGGSYYVEDVQAAADLVNAVCNPYETEITAYDLHPYGR